MPSMVFISYAREDRAAALKIAEDLHREGIAIWIDDTALRAGEDWERAIAQAIREADFFLALLSVASVGKAGHVQVELRRAYEVLETQPESGVFVLPCRLEPCEVPFRLRNLHTVDMFPSWATGIRKLVQSIRAPQPTTTEPPRLRPSITSLEGDPRAKEAYSESMPDGDEDRAKAARTQPSRRAVLGFSTLASIAAIIIWQVMIHSPTPPPSIPGPTPSTSVENSTKSAPTHTAKLSMVRTDQSVTLTRASGVDLDSGTQGDNSIPGLDLWGDNEKPLPAPNGVKLTSVSSAASADACLTSADAVEGINLYDTYNGTAPIGSQFCVTTDAGEVALIRLLGINTKILTSRWKVVLYKLA